MTFDPETNDLVVYQGATFNETFMLTTQNDAGEEIPFDLSGWTARMQIREKVKSETALITLTTENGGIIFDSETVDGALSKTTLTLYMDPDQTETLVVKKGVYDVKLEDALGDVIRLYQGNVTISPSVTRGVV